MRAGARETPMPDLIEFLDEQVFRCRWNWLCDKNDRRITQRAPYERLDVCGQPFPCAHRAHNPDCNHPMAGI